MSAANLAKYKTSLKKKSKIISAIKSPSNSGSLRPNPLSNVLNSTLRFCSGGTINAGAGGAIATSTFKINSMFAHQPTGFDQLAVLYSRYRTESVRLDLKIAANSYAGGQSGTNCGAYVFGLMITDSATPPTGYRQPIENGMTVYNLGAVGTDTTRTVSMKVDIPKLLGRKADDDELSALVTADPAKILYCHIFIQAVDSAIDLSVLGYVFLLEFKGKFLEPVNVAASS